MGAIATEIGRYIPPEPEMRREIIPEDLITEVLLRLPAADQGRFKIVSKAWLSILSDPYFLKQHKSRQRSSAFVFVSRAARFYYARPRINRAEHSLMDWFFPSSLLGNEDFGATDVVNGLCCIYSKERSEIYLFNICTREIRQLPCPDDTLVEPRSLRFMYLLGFDPTYNVYKVVRIDRERMNDEDPRDFRISFLILTLGPESPVSDNMKWRRLGTGTTPLAYFSPGRCFAGILYRRAIDMSTVCIDLNRECFKVVPPPVSLGIDVPASDCYLKPVIYDGRYALVKTKRSPPFWNKSDLIKYYDEGIDVLILENWETGLWKRTQIPNIPPELPSDKKRSRCFNVVAVGNLPSGDILLAVVRMDAEPMTVYPYDPKMNSYGESFVVSNSRSSSGPFCPSGALFLFTGLTAIQENITPLDHILGPP